MRTSERLKGLEQFFYENLCRGRQMKSPAEDFDITQIQMREPKCYTGFYPSIMDDKGNIQPEEFEPLENIAPSILIMPNVGAVKNVEEKRFDRYNGIARSQSMGQELVVQMLFCIYEPGVRLPGFIESAESGGGFDMSLFEDGTQQGMLTLFNWIDDAMELLLCHKSIPHTDLFLDEASCTYGPHTDQNFLTDKRPLYYGLLNATFYGYANEGTNTDIDRLLK